MNFLNHMFQSLVLDFKNQSRCELRTDKIIKRSHLLIYFQLFSRSLRVLPYNNSSNCSSPLLIEAYPTKSIIIFDNHFRTSPQPKQKITILSLLRSLNIKIPQPHALKKVVIVKASFKVQSSYQAKIQITCLYNKNKQSDLPLVIQNKNNLNKFKVKKKQDLQKIKLYNRSPPHHHLPPLSHLPQKFTLKNTYS